MLRQAIQERSKRFLEAISGAKSENVALILLRDYKRWLCRNDLFFLACITGHDSIVKWWKFYRPVCDEVSLQNWKVVDLGTAPASEMMLGKEAVATDEDLKYLQRLYLCYRIFYKTTIVTKLHTLQLLLNFPNIHICLAHNKQENAGDNLVTVKNYFLTKPVLSQEIQNVLQDHYGIKSGSIRHLFPECIPDTKEWGNMSGFSLANRTDKQITEENVEAVGVDTEFTGRHWQVAKKNDLVTEKSVTTEDQLKKTMDWDDRFNLGCFHDQQIPLQDYEGTTYHPSDLYSHKKNDHKIKLIQYPIVQDLKKFDETGEGITHPERFTVEGINDLKKNMWVFMTQLMLRPEDPAKMQFKMEMIHYFDTIPLGAETYVLVDPATARKKRSDYTVILVVKIIVQDGVFKKYVVDGYRDRFDSKQRVDVAIDTVRRWQARGIAWETLGFQETDTYYYEEKRRLMNLPVVTPIKSHNVSKEDRIRGLVPEYANGEWYWPQKGKVVKNSVFDGRNYDLTDAMEYELLNFPLAEHDDLLDAMTFLNRMEVSRPQFKEEEYKPEEMTFGEFHRMMDEQKRNVPDYVVGSYT